MKLKVFTMRFSSTADSFDDEPLREFTVDKEVVDYTEHFFEYDGTPYLTVVLAYREMAPDEKRIPRKQESPENELAPEERAVYDALRTWRAARAQAEGIPPYMIANNRQLARFVKLRAGTLADLTKVNGIGEQKIARYGAEILEILVTHPGNQKASATDTETEAQP